MGEQIGLFDPPQRRRVEFEKRDRVLDSLAERRQALIAEAKRVAVMMAKHFGSVTAHKVLESMKADPVFGPLMKNVDPRWIGVVFREKGWAKIGRVPDGSHGREVSVWTWRG